LAFYEEKIPKNGLVLWFW